MRRYHLLFSGVSILLAILGASTVWWRLSLEGGAVLDIAGTDSSSALWSLGAVAVAAWGLQFPLRGLARRIIAGVQALLEPSLLSSLSLLRALRSPPRLAQ